MRLIYLLLFPTFGMHQYTADLANRMAAEPGMEVHLVTTANLPRDRYSPAVRIHTPVLTHGTGFSAEGLNPAALRRVLRTVDQITAGRGQKAGVRGPEGRHGLRQDDHEPRHPPPATLTPDTPTPDTPPPDTPTPDT